MASGSKPRPIPGRGRARRRATGSSRVALDFGAYLGTGQLVLIPESGERLERIEFAEGIAVRVPPRLDIETILVSGGANLGTPTLVNTNITPSAVAELVQAGDAIEEIADLYEIPPRLVNDAGLFTYEDS